MSNSLATIMKRLATLLLILTICGALRIWLIVHTHVIAGDGTTYVKMAQEWLVDPHSVMRDYDQHPGYPVAMAGMHRVLRMMGRPDGVPTWELSGQIVSLGAGLAGVAAVWVFAGITFNWRVAWITGLLFGIGRKWSALGADVLSDALTVSLQMWAVVFSIIVLGQLKRKSRWSIVLGGCVGLCAGLGYLVRPEALLVAILGGMLWLAYQLRRRKSWRLTLGAVGVALTVTVLCALPYMVAIGRLTKKKTLNDIIASPGVQEVARATVSFLSTGEHGALQLFTGKLFEAMHPLVGVLSCVWLVSCAVGRFGRFRRTEFVFPSPRAPGAFMMLGTLAVMGPLLMNMYTNVHYLSHRHVMFLAGLLSPLGGSGVILLVDYLGTIFNRLPRLKISKAVILAIMICVMAGSLSLHTLRPLHRGKRYLRQGAQVLSESIEPGDYVLTDSSRIIHYSQVEGTSLPTELIAADGFILWVRQSKATHLVISDRNIRKVCPKLSDKLVPPRFTEIAKFVELGDHPDTIRMYRINRNGVSRTGD